MATDAVSSSAGGALFLILLQISSRALTFALNQVLLRFLSPALLGASVQLELYIITVHHFARESIRVACQRQSKAGMQATINTSYVAAMLGFPIAGGLASWYIRKGIPDVDWSAEAIRLCQLAAIIELLSESAFVTVQQNMLYKTRAAAEASAVVVKTFLTAGVVFWAHYCGYNFGVMPFAIGEFAYCSTLSVVYIWKTLPVASAQNYSLLLKRIPSNRSSPDPDIGAGLFSLSLLNLSFSLYIQSGIKYVLTMGDQIVSAILASLEEQGMYALSANYGGLIARMVFRPIEDASRNMFAKLCSSPSEPDKKENADLKDNSSDNIRQAASTLRDILRMYSIFSLVAFAIGPAAAPLLLRLVAGSRWSESGAGEVLGTYTLSIPLLAINGVSEAFVAATATTKDLHWQSIWMAVFSAAFAGSAYVFLRVLELGAKGLVWSNVINMTLRIIFNGTFVVAYFKRQGVVSFARFCEGKAALTHDAQDFILLDLLPNPYAIGAAAIVPSVLARTSGMLDKYGLLGELVRIGAVGAGLVIVM